MYGVFEELATGKRREKIEGQGDKALSAALEAEVFENLSKQEQDEFYRTCRKLKIDKFDTELFRIMSLFQYQRRYLDEIPVEIVKHKKELEKHREEIVTLSEQAAEGADEIEKHLETIKELTANTVNPLTTMTERATEIVEKTTGKLHQVMRDNLKDMEVEAGQAVQGIRDEIYATLNNIFVNVQETFERDLRESLHINHIDVINQSVVEVAQSRVKTAEMIKEDTLVLDKELNTIKALGKEYRAEVRAIKWANWRWCSASMLVIVLCSWFFFHLNYRARLSEMRDVVVSQAGENQAILSALAKGNRRLELGTHENGNKMLLIRNAKGWTTFENHGVIEFK